MPTGLKLLLFWLGGFAAGFSGLLPLRAAASPEPVCNAAGRAAEQSRILPANVLVSIGMVESGRIDPATGRFPPWPWTVNVDGAAHYFDDEREAAEFALQSEAAGAKDVDVGCFQISLQQHPGAFASMDAAFDPAGNANFAGGFLKLLQVQTGSWDSAVADYHSASPYIGPTYLRLVMTAWRLLGGVPAITDAVFMTRDPSVILAGPATTLVRVITMTGDSGPAFPVRKGLPRVITP